MAKFVQHIPTFCDGFEPEEYVFLTQDELLSTAIFKRAVQMEKHSHFSLSKYDWQKSYSVLHITDGGFHWRVLGFVDDASVLNFPEWDKGRNRAILDGEEVVIEGKDVSSYCGDEVRLKDGRVAIRKGATR